MKCFLRLSMLMTAVGLAVACSGPTKPEHESFVYPLAVGNQWVYEYTEISTYSDSTPTDTVRYTMTARVILADTILPGIVSYTILEEGANQHGEEYTGFKAYVNMPEGMYAYYRSDPGPQFVLPKHTGLGRVQNPVEYRLLWLTQPALFPFLELRLSGIEYYNPTPLLLPYPQRVGHRWSVLDTAVNGFFGIDQQIAGWETITTPAGAFDCVAIDWIHIPPLDDVEITSYFAAEGMIRRTVSVFDIDVTTYEFPYGTGETKDIYETYELVSYTLKTP